MQCVNFCKHVGANKNACYERERILEGVEIIMIIIIYQYIIIVVTESTLEELPCESGVI